MHSRSIGMKTKHMGMKWMKVDDQFTQIAREPSKDCSESFEDDFEGFPDNRVFESLNNVTFEIPEEPEYKKSTPKKLIFDEYPEPIFHRPVRGRVSKSTEFYSKKSSSPTPSVGQEDQSRLKNIYYYLHRPQNQGYSKYQTLQKKIKSSDTTDKYISYLQQRNKRVPSYLHNPYV